MKAVRHWITLRFLGKRPRVITVEVTSFSFPEPVVSWSSAFETRPFSSQEPLGLICNPELSPKSFLGGRLKLGSLLMYQKENTLNSLLVCRTETINRQNEMIVWVMWVNVCENKFLESNGDRNNAGMKSLKNGYPCPANAILFQNGF